MKLFSYPSEKKSRVIFLDKDGVLNYDKAGKYITDLKDLKIYRSAIRGLKKLRNYKLIIITNQSAIGRGYITLSKFKKIAYFMLKEFVRNGIKFDGFYFCPHKPSDNCPCRKPKLGLIKEAEKDFKIDFNKSFMVGDKNSDIIMAKRANLKSIFVLTGQAKRQIKKYNIKADFVIKDLRELRKILNK